MRPLFSWTLTLCAGCVAPKGPTDEKQLPGSDTATDPGDSDGTDTGQTDDTGVCCDSEETADSGRDDTGPTVQTPACPTDTATDATCPGCTYIDIATGAYGSMAISDDGSIRYWGDYEEGLWLARPAGTYRDVAMVSSVACGVRDDNYACCWGYDPHDDLANAPAEQVGTVSLGGEHACAIRLDGTLTCWGDNAWGRTSAPEGIFAQVVTGTYHSCGLHPDGTIECWGIGPEDAGLTGYEGRDVGQVTDTLSGEYVAIAAGGSSNCAINTYGYVYCWGNYADYFAETFDDDTFVNISITEYGRACGINSLGEIVCTVATSGSTAGDTPPAGNNFVQVSVGTTHGCALDTEGAITCWGTDHYGETIPP